MKKAFVYIILAGVLWGTSGLFVNHLAPIGFSSLQMTAVRGIVSTLCLALYLFLKDKNLFKITKHQLLLTSLSGFGMFGTAASYYASMQASSVSTAVVLMYTAPIYITIYSVMFFGEKMTPLKTLAITLMLIGCGLVSGIVGGFKFSIAGILLGFLSGIAYGAYNIFTKMEMREDINPLTATFYCFFFMMLSAVVTSNPPQFISIIASDPVKIIPLFIFMGLCTAVTPYFLYTLALKKLPAGTASALGIVEPMAATLYSVVFLHEPLSLPSLCGIILILGSVFLLSRSKE